jgi:DnaJ-class molecular chaperone
MSLYETLEIDPTASEARIKQAFRAKAKRAHPDSGGSPDEFHALCLAYGVLSDPLRKRQYDESGTTDPLGNAIAQTAFDAVIGAAMQLSSYGFPPSAANLVAEAAQLLRSNLSQTKQNRLATLRGLQTVAKLKERFKTTGETSLRALLEAGEARHKTNYDTQIAVIEGAIRVLEAHTFEKDPPTSGRNAGRDQGPRSLGSLYSNV